MSDVGYSTFSVFVKVKNVVVLNSPWWRFWNRSKDIHSQYRWKRVVLTLQNNDMNKFLCIQNKVLYSFFNDNQEFMESLSVNEEKKGVHLFGAQLEEDTVPTTYLSATGKS